MKAFSYVLVLLFFTLVSCESAISPDTDRLGWQYYPLETGRYYEYSIEEITVNPDWQNDTLRYLLRTELADAFENGAGTESVVMFRYRRDDEQDPWEFESSWTVRRDFGRLVVYEENLPFIKLSFPVNDGLEWDGNSLNTFMEDTYSLFESDQLINLPDGTEVEGITVVQEDLFDLIIGKEDFRTEQYAENIGLVRRETRLINYCNSQGCLGDTIPESGSIYIKQLLEYGQED